MSGSLGIIFGIGLSVERFVQLGLQFSGRIREHQRDVDPARADESRIEQFGMIALLENSHRRDHEALRQHGEHGTVGELTQGRSAVLLVFKFC